MNYSFNTGDMEATNSIRCKLKRPDKEPEDSECFIKEGQLIINADQPIIIPVHRIEAHKIGGPGSPYVEIMYRDDLDNKQLLSLEMPEAAYFDFQISSNKAQWLESLPIEQRYAGFRRRLVAYIIDCIILTIFNWMVLFIIWGIISDGRPTSDGLFSGLPGEVYALAIAIGMVYYIGFWAWRGATPGKMLMGVKIVKADGSPVKISRAIIRYAGYYFSVIIILIGYLMIAWDHRKQGLHDKIAGTVAIRDG